MNFDGMQDEEICRLAESDSAAEEYLLIKYKPLVRREARTLFLTYGDKEDLIQEGMIGLYHAVRDFRPDAGARFQTFARRCVLYQMYNAIQAGERKRNIPMKEYISLSDPDMRMDETVGMSLQKQTNPEQILIDQENAQNLKDSLISKLSKLEQVVLKDYINGLDYVEIAKKLGREPKSIDNAIQRIRTKMKQVLAEEKTK